METMFPCHRRFENSSEKYKYFSKSSQINNLFTVKNQRLSTLKKGFLRFFISISIYLNDDKIFNVN